MYIYFHLIFIYHYILSKKRIKSLSVQFKVSSYFFHGMVQILWCYLNYHLVCNKNCKMSSSCIIGMIMLSMLLKIKWNGMFRSLNQNLYKWGVSYHFQLPFMALFVPIHYPWRARKTLLHLLLHFYCLKAILILYE